MKKLIALVAVVTMLFAMVGTASAYDVAMEVMVNPNLIQTGPSPNYYPGDKYDLSYSFTPSDTWKFSNNITVNISGKYSDAKPWYNYGNSNEQAAWLRIPIIFDSVDKADFPSVNTKSTQWTDGKLIQQGSYVTINGVMYPVGVIQGHTAPTSGTSTYRYNPFVSLKADSTYDAGWQDSTNMIESNALGVMYSVKLQSGGMSETLNVSYTPNGVEVYKATITIIYMDTAVANNATMAREIGSNAPYFNAKFNGGDTMAFDTVLKSGSMISTSEKYYFRDNASFNLLDDDSDWAVYEDYNGGAPYAKDKGYISFPTIVMQAKVKLLDKNGNALPARTQVKGNVDANDDTADNSFTRKHYADMTDTIVNTATNAAIINGFLFRAGDVYDSTFSASTKTDDGYYLELDSNGEFTVTVRVIDNSTALYKGMLNEVVNDALTNKYTMKPYCVPLENVESRSITSSTIEGVKNRVNYKYIGDVKQDVYTYNMYDRQYLKYDINVNSLDRIEASSFAITGNSSEMLAVGSTRQLQATTGHASAIITDRQVNWKSSNPAVATVNATTGLVTAVADGTTYITASYAVGTGYDTVAVTVGTAPVATPEITAPTTTQYFVAVGSSSSLNVRSGANTKSARVGRLKRGDTVNVYEIVDGWAKIDYNGSIAYVSSRYISQ